MGQVFYPQFADTVPTGPAELTTEQIIAHTKRPYVARGLDQQGRRETPTRIPREASVSLYGIAFLAACAASAMIVLALLANWLAY